MKLSEINAVADTEYLQLLIEIEHLEEVERDCYIELLQENVITDTATNLVKIVKAVHSSNNKKTAVNAKLGEIYNAELAKVKEIFNKLKDQFKKIVSDFFKKVGIVLQGVDISRKNYLRRFCILKLSRLIIEYCKNLVDDNKEELAKKLIKLLFPAITPFLELTDIKSSLEMIRKVVETMKKVQKVFSDLNAATTRQEQSAT